MQITVTEKISVATTRENFPLSTRTLSSVSRFSKEILHLASIQRNYNSTRYVNFVRIFVRKSLVTMFPLILCSPIKLVDHIRSHRFRENREIFLVHDDRFRAREIHLAHYHVPPLGNIYRDTCDRLHTFVRFGATPLKRSIAQTCTVARPVMFVRSAVFRFLVRVPSTPSASAPLPRLLFPSTIRPLRLSC